MNLRVLVAMECSGVIREALRAVGLDAWSCDLKAAEDGSSFHIVGDVFKIIRGGKWRMVIAHPVCKYLTVSAEWAYKDPDFTRYPNGGYHQKLRPGTKFGHARREARKEAVQFVIDLDRACEEEEIEFYAFENPVGALSRLWRPADMYIQIYDFGENISKRTGWWVKKLPMLKPTARFVGRFVEWPPGSGKMVERWGNQTDSGQNIETPGDDRETNRSRTLPGVAVAIADQWGRLLFPPEPFFLDGR